MGEPELPPIPPGQVHPLTDHGLAMPRDEDAIARTKTLLQEARDRVR
jgi:hypothetical protein